MINVQTEPKVYLSKKKSGYYAKLRYTYLGKEYEKSYPLGKEKAQALIEFNKKRDLYDELSQELKKLKELDRQIYKLMLKSESYEDLGLKTAIANLTFDRSKYNVRFRSGSFFENLGDKLILDDIRMEVSLQWN